VTQGKDKKLGIEANSERREVTAVTAELVSKELKLFARVKWPLANDKARKAALRRALDVTARRIKSLWEGEETAVPRGTETARIEKLIGHKIGAAAELEEARHEHRDLAQLAASLQALLFGPEADFYRPQVDAIRAALVPAGGGTGSGSGDAGAGDQGRSEAAVADLFE
jgi:hypothetical protein